MGDCLIHRAGSPFKAFMEVTATPGSTVTATLSGTDIIYTGTADSDGKVSFILKKKGRIYSNVQCVWYANKDHYRFNKKRSSSC